MSAAASGGSAKRLRCTFIKITFIEDTFIIITVDKCTFIKETFTTIHPTSLHSLTILTWYQLQRRFRNGQVQFRA